MGSACCVAARGRKTILPNTNTSSSTEESFSWNCQWDNQGELGNQPSGCSYGRNESVGLEARNSDVLDGEGLLDSSRIGHKSPSYKGGITHASDISTGTSFSAEVKGIIAPLTTGDPLVSRPPLTVPVTSSSSLSKVGHLPSESQSLTADATPSSKARRSPGHQLFRQVSSGRIQGLKSPYNTTSEGRQSFVLSTCSNDVQVGSQGGSSDGWSMCAFSDLVASSRRERWSFDGESLDSSRAKVTRSNSRLLASPVDLQSCGVCSKILTDKSPWMGQKIIISNELSVVAVLVCGHVYHAECLENMTPETDKFDPPCPMCATGHKQLLRLSSTTLRTERDPKARNRVARNRVIDSNLDGDYVLSDHWKNIGRAGKVPKMAPSSSMRSSFAKPFLKRHFSLGSRSAKSILENESSARAHSRKGFWQRYLKE